jgi:hypothetical protein
MAGPCRLLCIHLFTPLAKASDIRVQRIRSQGGKEGTKSRATRRQGLNEEGKGGGKGKGGGQGEQVLWGKWGKEGKNRNWGQFEKSERDRGYERPEQCAKRARGFIRGHERAGEGLPRCQGQGVQFEVCHFVTLDLVASML